MVVPAYSGHLVLRINFKQTFLYFMGIFKVRKVGMGFFWGLFFGPGIFLGLLVALGIYWDLTGAYSINFSPI